MTFKITSMAAAVLIIAACHSSKKATTATTPAPATTPVTATTPAPAKNSKGIYSPGNEELTAIQTKYPEATLPVLTEGYNIYIGEACTACHNAKGIYRISESKWPQIIDDMVGKARLTAYQKDALTKFVFSIKATQPPSAK